MPDTDPTFHAAISAELSRLVANVRKAEKYELLYGGFVYDEDFNVSPPTGVTVGENGAATIVTNPRMPRGVAVVTGGTGKPVYFEVGEKEEPTEEDMALFAEAMTQKAAWLSRGGWMTREPLAPDQQIITLANGSRVVIKDGRLVKLKEEPAP